MSPSAKIKMPWHLTLEHRACLGERVEVYNLAPVALRERCVVAQHTYLCGGTHSLNDLELLPVLVGEIEIGADAFVGARALILPGVKIGPGAVIGAGAVVSRDAPAWMVCAGNPCRPVKPRTTDTPVARS
ncbi:MAG TPA: DapH/DapD/GlmU-related protein [Candidatus Krumholzibacteria bacterium]